ncbi:hypothetical protein J31TS4_34710 [Paenibacillus sp. J31TS4]|uniref:spore germination protein GerPC n=1 Tax=Paenibacillus sp. J31TS4 TaxID=2807195 RepID=UPI001B2822AB|nr:spore germination protein GerPC [Paenibacillus sp. J31TS4]GIP40191.1 hypothetical protein J31TS4_34710 [Paenibacillus sp. J31TS4]
MQGDAVMLFLEWFRRGPSAAEVRLRVQLAELEGQLKVLEERLRCLAESKEQASPPTVIIHRAEKLVIEKIDHSNHFGTIDIKELTGRLNIGANYSGFLPLPDAPTVPKKEGEGNGKVSGTEGVPRCHVRAKDGL